VSSDLKRKRSASSSPDPHKLRKTDGTVEDLQWRLVMYSEESRSVQIPNIEEAITHKDVERQKFRVERIVPEGAPGLVWVWRFHQAKKAFASTRQIKLLGDGPVAMTSRLGEPVSDFMERLRACHGLCELSMHSWSNHRLVRLVGNVTEPLISGDCATLPDLQQGMLIGLEDSAYVKKAAGHAPPSGIKFR
jgi:hypothetical protein